MFITVRRAAARPGSHRMFRCPQCHAEKPTALAVCPKCQSAAPGLEDTPTLHTRPRLLVLRPTTKSADPRVTDPAGPSAAPFSDPTPTPTAMPPRLRVIRGLKVHVEYPLCEGQNLIGRGDDRPVDVDLRDQEPTDRVWASRHHAVIHIEEGALTIEDLNSMNGTYVNRHRVYPGQKRTLKAGDVLQIGTIQLKLTL
jgi:pSer/pThr/pTyr-binding forkhead associated (FHA) protein